MHLLSSRESKCITGKVAEKSAFIFENIAVKMIILKIRLCEKGIFYKKCKVVSRNAWIQSCRKGGHNVYFLENPSDGKMYEISQRDQLPGGATTRVDHIAYRSEELEKDYTYCKEHGYKILSDEIEVSPNFWEKGSRCFKIESPCAFCQMHADSFGS
jgi:lactoylglutathione lyase